VNRLAVLVGGTSYVGGWAASKLLDAGYRVIVVTRRPGLAQAMLGDAADRLVIATHEEAVRLCGGQRFSLVNFAYVTVAPPHRRFQRDRELAQSIERLAAEGCDRLVQLSTAAVFGDTFSEPPRPVRVRWRPMESLYAESKIRQEHLIERAARRVGCEIAVVRLGNVIGPGAPAWVARLAQRILEVRPLAYDREQGFSNSTYVENVAHYIEHLLDAPAGALPGFGTYHHLAEFSSRRWPELFDVMSDAIGYPWATAARPAPHRGGRGRGVFASAYNTTVGGHARALSALLPKSERIDRWVAAKRAPRPLESGQHEDLDRDDERILDVCSAAVEFRSSTVAGWAPAVDFPSACAGIADWLRSSGFSLG
jgi:nucleoside-diphosphate-sugar epimerase